MVVTKDADGVCSSVMYSGTIVYYARAGILCIFSDPSYLCHRDSLLVGS